MISTNLALKSMSVLLSPQSTQGLKFSSFKQPGSPRGELRYSALITSIAGEAGLAATVGSKSFVGFKMANYGRNGMLDPSTSKFSLKLSIVRNLPNFESSLCPNDLAKLASLEFPLEFEFPFAVSIFEFVHSRKIPIVVWIRLRKGVLSMCCRIFCVVTVIDGSRLISDLKISFMLPNFLRQKRMGS